MYTQHCQNSCTKASPTKGGHKHTGSEVVKSALKATTLPAHPHQCREPKVRILALALLSPTQHGSRAHLPGLHLSTSAASTQDFDQYTHGSFSHPQPCAGVNSRVRRGVVGSPGKSLNWVQKQNEALCSRQPGTKKCQRQRETSFHAWCQNLVHSRCSLTTNINN